MTHGSPVVPTASGRRVAHRLDGGGGARPTTDRGVAIRPFNRFGEIVDHGVAEPLSTLLHAPRLGDRERAASCLGLSTLTSVRAGATPDGLMLLRRPSDIRYPGRVGIGLPAAPVELGRSWNEAKLALRFAADGTSEDPGPRIINAAALGCLLVIPEVLDATPSDHPDVLAVRRACEATHWMLELLTLAACSGSVREAAAAAYVHHSTMQKRWTQAEQILGWSMKDSAGKLRLALALAVWRVRRSTNTAAHAII